MSDFKKNIYIILWVMWLPHTIMAQTTPSSLKHEAQKHMSAGRYGEAIALLSELITLHPEMADAYILRGLSYENRGQFKYAIIDFKQAIESEPENIKYQQDLKRVTDKHREIIQKRIDKYKRELKINPNLTEHYFSLGQFYEEVGDWEEAENWYAKYFELDDLSSDKVIRYAEILANNNQLKKGEQILRKYLTRYPNDHKLISRYGYFLMWLGKSQQAIQTFERALEIKPFYKEAQDGLAQAKGERYPGLRTNTGEFSDAVEQQQPVSSPQSLLERYLQLLNTNPKNNKMRLLLIKEFMKHEKYEQAAAHAEIYEKNLTSDDNPKFIESLKDSLYEILISQYAEKFKDTPSDRDIMEKLSVYYNNLGLHQNSMNVMQTYFKNVSIESDPQMAFRYAQHCAWYGKPDDAEYILKMLLEKDPNNLDYQLLLGQVLVWNGNDLEKAQEYLENVHNRVPRNIYAILTLASLNITKHDLDTAHEYIELAKTLDPANEEIPVVEKYYQTELKSERERKVYQILEKGRELVNAGKYKEALEQYESYFGRVVQPQRLILVEYAELNISAKNLKKAISIFNELLAEKYDFDIAVKSAKTLLWAGEVDSALAEFDSLCKEAPDNFECRLFMGDAYLQKKDYKNARLIYSNLMKTDLNAEQKNMVMTRFQYLPETGFAKIFSDIPNHLGLNPSGSFYSDNQNFQIYHLGGTGQVGLAAFLTAGASFVKSNVASENRQRDFSLFKGRLMIKPLNNLTINSGFGTMNSMGELSRNVMDVSVTYAIEDRLNAAIYYENSDAALILYSPFLVDRRFDADFYKFTGSYQSQSKIILSGHFSYLSISDGNKGNDVLIRIGREFFTNTSLGYESQYLNYKYQAPAVPGSNGYQMLYYSPQNLDSHSLWMEWQPSLVKAMDVNFGAKIGYLPELDIVLRQIDAVIQYQLVKSLILHAKVSAGSSYRFDSSYNYFSCSVSAYWSIY